jgi:Zn-dependent protease with chaperone function
MMPPLAVSIDRLALSGLGERLDVALHGVARFAAPVAVTALWQGVAVAGALALVFRLAPRVPASHRFVAWAAGFVAVAALPLAPLFLHAAGSGESSGVTAAGAIHQPWLQLDMQWSLAIAALWASFSLMRAVDLAVHAARVRRLWKRAIPVTLPGPMSARDGWFGLRRSSQICSTLDLDRPNVIGFFAPRILLPRWLLERMTPAELEQVVMHEAEHLRRGDDWTNLLQKVCLVLFPLNPALWWMERQLCREREMACDEGVVRQTRAPRAYAACLASLAERGLARRAAALSLGAWQRRPELVNRVHRILARKPALSPLATGAFLAVVGCGLVAGSVELARCPQLVAFVPSQSSVARSLPKVEVYAQGRAAASSTTPIEFQRRGALHRNRTAAAVELESHMDSTAQLERMTPLQEAGPTRAEATRAVMPDRRQARAEQGQAMILTAWEQMEVVQIPVAQQSTGENVVMPDEGRFTAQPVQQFTVTRLIFRVLAGQQVQRHAGPPVAREGWLVLQL